MVGWEEEGPVTAGRPFDMLRTGYGVGFNRQHKRNGHLLQNRYKSIGCQEETYLQELVRYIHLNPLRAGVVPDLTALSRYPYCGHSALMGKRNGLGRMWTMFCIPSVKGSVAPGGNIFYTLRRGLSKGAVAISLEGGWFAQGG